MHIYNLPHLQSHEFSDLATVDRLRADLILPATIAGRYVARHYNIDASIADTIGVLAGLGPKPEAN